VCEQRINIYDCQTPRINTNAPLLFVVQIPLGGTVELVAKDFITDILDDCTPADRFLYSLKQDEYQPDSSFFGCDAEAFGVELNLDVWIADQGIDKNCDGLIEWQERQLDKHTISVVYTEDGYLDCWPGDPFISGQIRREYFDGIRDVHIVVNSPGQPILDFVTDASGQYSYIPIGTTSGTTIIPGKNDLHRNGVSTLDLIKIKKHLNGIEPITNPYLLIAADATNSQSISLIDLIEIRKLILGRTQEFSSNKSWRFIPEDFVFENPLSPWPFDETIAYTDYSTIQSFNFIGIKVGDVNYTALTGFNLPAPRELIPPLEIITSPQTYKAGDIISVPLILSEAHKLTGLQFTLSMKGLELLDILPGMINLSEEHCAHFEENMTLSWFDENSIEIAGNDRLFTLQFRAVHDGILSRTLKINSEITEAEMYLDEDQIFHPVLSVIDENGNSDAEIISCHPNPWKEKTTIRFDLKEEKSITFTLTDLNGKDVFNKSHLFQRGENTFEISSAEHLNPGLYFLKINDGKNPTIQKTIIAE
jgi:hypothetical protein